MSDVVVKVLPDATVVEADCLKCTIDRLNERQAQLVCLDLDMPGLGCDSLEALLRGEDSPRFLLMCDSLEPYQARRLLKHSCVAGFIPRSAGIRSIENVFQIVAEGGRYLPSHLDMQPRSDRRRDVKLSRRQRQVLEGLAAGRSTADIAQSLGISHAMVKAHVRSACRALGARNRVMAVFIAERHGLLEVKNLGAAQQEEVNR